MNRYFREFLVRLSQIIFRYQKIIRFIGLMLILYIGYLQIGFILTTITFSNIYLHESRINYLEEKIKKRLKCIEKNNGYVNKDEEKYSIDESTQKGDTEGKRGRGRPRKVT